MSRGVNCPWEVVPLAPNGRVANLPLGVIRDVAFDQQSIPLHRGARLLLYTDGLAEAPGVRGEMLVRARLLRLLNDQWDTSIVDLRNRVLESLQEHTGGEWSHDDVTFMGVEITCSD